MDTPMNSSVETEYCNLTPYCSKILCKQEKHHELLEFLTNTTYFNRDDQPKLDKLIQKYEEQGWKREDPIPDPEPAFRYPLFHWASALAKVSTVKYLVTKEGFSPNSLTPQKDTPFHRAIACLGSTKTRKPHKYLEGLLNMMPNNITVINAQGQTPLLLLTDMLLKMETTVPFFSEGVRVIVECAMKLSKEDKYKALNCQNKDGNTALHLMVQRDGMLPDIKRLVEAKCKLNIENKSGLTALFVAEELNQREYVKVFRLHMPACMSRRFLPRISPVKRMDGETVVSPKKRFHPLRDSDSENTESTQLESKRQRRKLNPVTDDISTSVNSDTDTTDEFESDNNNSCDTNDANCHDQIDSTQKNGLPGSGQTGGVTVVEGSTTRSEVDSAACLQNVNLACTKCEQEEEEEEEESSLSLTLSNISREVLEVCINTDEEDSVIDYYLKNDIIPIKTEPDDGISTERTEIKQPMDEIVEQALRTDGDEQSSSCLLRYLKMSPAVKQEINKILVNDRQMLETSHKEIEAEIKEICKDERNAEKEEKESQSKVIELLKEVERLQSSLSDIKRKKRILVKTKAKKQDELKEIVTKMEVLDQGLEDLGM
ncbi:uncharacterized protein LOC144434297 [Glandiceps talaboti]